MQRAYVFERLGPTHDRTGFSCANPSLENYLKRQARQEQDKRVAAVFVLTDSATRATVLGYYTLSATAVAYTDLPPETTRKLPRYPYQPAILIGRLAVDTRFASQGYGRRLLIDALRRGDEAEIGAIAVVVDAIDDTAAAFYRHHGFIPTPEQDLRLYRRMKDIRASLPTITQ